MENVKASFNNSCKNNNASHNDRSFETEPSDERIVILIGNKQRETTVRKLMESEYNAYQKFFSERLNEINDKYIKQRKKSKTKTMLQYYEDNKPRETIRQFGNVDNTPVSYKIFRMMNDRYLEKEKKFYDEHGIRCVILNSAFHIADPNRKISEATTHVHDRRLYLCKTKTGTLEHNVTGCFEAAGFTRPDPSKPKSRYNNVMVTVDGQLRDLWLEACREIVAEQHLDFNVLDYDKTSYEEREQKRKKQKNMKQYKEQKDREYREKVKELEAREKELDEREKNLQEREKSVSEIENGIVRKGMRSIKNKKPEASVEDIAQKLQDQADGKPMPMTPLRQAIENRELPDISQTDDSTDFSL